MEPEKDTLTSAFERLSQGQVSQDLELNALAVERLSHTPRAFAAVDQEGNWALVLESMPSKLPRPSLKLKVLSADYGGTYQLISKEKTGSLRVCVISCKSPDHAVRQLFASFCTSVLESFTESSTDEDIEQEVDRWRTLFWRLETPPQTSVIGLIGELVFLDWVQSKSKWVKAWHDSIFENIDFAIEDPHLSVEVKATANQQRVHEFSLTQVRPVRAGRHYVASLIVEMREAGMSLGELVTELVDSLVSVSEKMTFWNTLTKICGSSLEDYMEARFMRDSTLQSLRFYDSTQIPQPSVEFPLPAGVSGIRFRADLTSTTTADVNGVLQRSSGIWKP